MNADGDEYEYKITETSYKSANPRKSWWPCGKNQATLNNWCWSKFSKSHVDSTQFFRQQEQVVWLIDWSWKDVISGAPGQFRFFRNLEENEGRACTTPSSVQWCGEELWMRLVVALDHWRQVHFQVCAWDSTFSCYHNNFFKIFDIAISSGQPGSWSSTST